MRQSFKYFIPRPHTPFLPIACKLFCQYFLIAGCFFGNIGVQAINIYELSDYQKILAALMLERKKTDPMANYQHMAEKIRVPKSYLSRVLHGKAHLSSDQMFLVCRYFDLNAHDSTYILTLLEYSRSGLRPRRQELLGQIRRMQSDNIDTSKHLTAGKSDHNPLDYPEYYLDPLLQIVHICLAIPRYQLSPFLLVDDLGVSLAQIQNAIEALERMRLIAKDNGKISLLLESMHLPKQSSLYKPWRNQIKLASLHQLARSPDDKLYSFAVTFSANEEIRQNILNKFLAYLKEVETMVSKAEAEHCYQLSFDLFPWTRAAAIIPQQRPIGT